MNALSHSEYTLDHLKLVVTVENFSTALQELESQGWHIENTMAVATDDRPVYQVPPQTGLIFIEAERKHFPNSGVPGHHQEKSTVLSFDQFRNWLKDQGCHQFVEELDHLIVNYRRLTPARPEQAQ